MSEYGRIWQEIQHVRERLADWLSMDVSVLSRLPEAIRRATEQQASRERSIGALLERWAELEAEAAKLDVHTGGPRR